MKKKIIISILITFLLIWTAFFTTDSIRCKNDQDPIFCIEACGYDDGGSVMYVGLFYNYYCLKTFNPQKTEDNYEVKYLEDKVITPWFCLIDYAKSKAFDE